MDILSIIEEYSNKIIIVGLLIGLLNFLDFLPSELPVLEANTKYLYMAIIGLALYSFLTFHMGTSSKAVKIQRTVPTRQMTNPKWKAEISKQMGNYEPPVANIPDSNPSLTPKTSRQIFDKFKKD